MRSLVLFFLFLFIFSVNPIWAADNELGKSRINPASPLYFLKTLKETLLLRLTNNSHKKALYQLTYASNRIKEVNSLVGTSQEELIEPTLEKYWFQIQVFFSQTNLDDPGMAELVSQVVLVHMNNLQEASMRVSDPRAERSIRLAINRLAGWEDQLIEKLKILGQVTLTQKVSDSQLSGCNFLAKEASSAALNAVEREVLASRADTCFKIYAPTN